MAHTAKQRPGENMRLIDAPGYRLPLAGLVSILHRGSGLMMFVPMPFIIWMFGASGRGGRNVEFLLSLAVALDGLAGVHAIAGDTDGVDGAEEIAGACLAPDTLARAWALGINLRTSLDNNDGHGFFQALGDSVITGPTLTNVNDFRAIVIDGPTTGAR